MSFTSAIKTIFRSARWLSALVFAGTALSALAANTATVTSSAATYSAAGGQVTFTVTLGYTTSLSALDMHFVTPTGWTYVSNAGASVPNAAVPQPGDLGSFGFDFVYSTIPTSPATFTFTLGYPANQTGNQVMSAIEAHFSDEATGNVSTVTIPSITLAPSLSAVQAIAAKSLTAGSAAPAFTPVTAVNGAGPYTWSITPALPSALVLNTTTGQITGTPAALQAATTYTVTITDSTNATAFTTFSLTINSAITTTVAIGSKALTVNTAAVAFTPVTASAGTSPYSYAITPALPTGLSINAVTGAISGTPTVTSAQTTYTVAATDAVGAVSSKTFTLVVNSALIANQAVPNPQLTAGNGAASSFVPVTASGGTAGYTYSISPALPSALAFSATTGSLSGTPAAPAAATVYTVTITDSVGATASNTFSLTINPPVTGTLAVATKGLTSGTLAVAFAPVTVTGGTSPYLYTVAPTLPTGLSIAIFTGVISGTPTVTTGATNYTITVNDSTGAQVAKTFSLTVNPALASTLAVATKGLTINTAAVAFTPVTTTGGTAPLAFSVTPALPAGLALDAATGSVSGTPTGTASSGNFAVSITDAAGASTTKTFALTVNGAVIATQAIATRTLTAGAAITAFTPVTATGGTGTLAYTIAPALPTGLAMSATTGAITGNPTAASGPTTYTVTATDTVGATASGTFALTVNGPVAATSLIAAKSLTVGAAANFAPVAGAGGTAPYTYSITPALPATLTLDANSGAISGTPTTAAAATTYTVKVTDTTSASATQTFSLTINAAVIATQSIAAKALTTGTAAVSFIPVTGSSGTAPYAYTVSPALPAALAINASTGAITGTPAAASAAATFTVTVTDAAGAVATNTFSLTVNIPLIAGTTLTSRTLTAGAAATSFTPLSLIGGTTPYVWSVSPALPAALVLNTSTGAITGTASAALASTNFTVTGTDAAGAQVPLTFALVVNPALGTTQALATVGPLTAGTAVVGAVIPVTASGGTTPYTYAVTPTLPAGLSFNASTGAITGTPTAASSATTYTVTVTDSVGATSSKTFSLTINGPLAATQAIATKSLTATTAVVAFTPVTAGGGTQPYGFSVAPALPTGLAISATTGAITGTPAAASGPTTFTVTVTDAASGSATATFSLTVNPALATTLAVATKSLTVGTAAVAFTPVTATDGTPAYAFTVTPALPAGLAISASTGAISGTPSALTATANYTITVTDSVGATSSKVLSLTVNGVLAAGPATIGTKTLTAGTAAVSFTPLPLTAGTTPYAFSVAPALPTGLVLSPTTGAITGTAAAAAATANYVITGMDAAGAQVTQTLSLTVNAALAATQAIASKAVLSNVPLTAFTPVTITGGTAPFVYTITPALPTGVSLAPATGAISGTPTVTLASSTFTITVTDAVGATATQTFGLSVSTLPVITTQPISANVNLNGTATFTAAASGFPTPTFQWKKGGTDITGNTSATTATLTIANAQLTDEAAYTVVATNIAGTATSTPAANLTVFVLPAITTQPAPQTILAGQSASFSVVATGKPTPTYQWKRNGVALSGQTNATLTLTNVPLNGGGDITVVVSNVSGAFGGSVTSSPAATLTVNPIAPVILSTPPLNATAVKDRSFLFGPITINNTPATFTATGLPDGLSVNATLGTISGTPTTVTVTPATIVLTATNVTGSDSRTIILTVLAPPPVISSAASASGRVGTAFSFSIIASNTPTSYGASGLPAPLAVNTSTGVITGTPTTAGTYTVQLTATNASGSVSQPLVLVIDPPLNAPVYTGSLSLSGTQGTAFTSSPSFGTVTAPYALTGALPTGLNFTAATGVIAGTPTQTGTFPVTLSATNAGGTTSVNLTIVINPAAAAPTITSASTAPAARVGTAFSFQLTSAGTPAATSYAASGLPAGLAINAATGVISGTPTAFGSFNVAVSATNTAGTGPASILSITVSPSAAAPVITSSPVITGQVGVAFSGVTLTSTPAATTYAITSGTMPAGLQLSSNGAITGTPLPAALGQTRVWFAGTAGGPIVAGIGGASTSVVSGAVTGLSTEVLFVIAPAAATPVVSSNGTATAQVGQPFQYVITASNGPLTSYAATGLPAWLTLDPAAGVLSGIPTEATTTAISIAISATNAAGAGNAKTLLLTVAPAPATPEITSALTASARVGTAFTYQIAASNTPTSYVATGLPAGLLFNAGTGAITGTPTVSNSYNVSIRAGNAAGLGAVATLVINVAPATAAPAIQSPATAAAQVGVAFTYQITVRTTDTPILGYALIGDGMLPQGLTLNTATGVISGTPADDPRTYVVQLTATNAGGTSLPQSVAINLAPAAGVPVVTAPLYVTGTVGTDFSLALTATNTGSAPYAPPIVFEAVGLPSGLVINPSAGTIVGKPTTVGNTVATLVASNAAGTGPTRDLTITILPAAAAPVVAGSTLAVGQVNQPFAYQIVASNPPLASYEVLGAPAWMSLDPLSGAVTGLPTAPGSFTVQLTATNAVGTSAPAVLAVTILPAANTPVITSTKTASGTVGSAFSYTPATTPAATGFTVAGLPGGLSLNPVSGMISGTPNTSGTFHVLLTPANANGLGAPVDFVITIVPNVTFN